MFKVHNKNVDIVIDVVLVSLMLSLKNVTPFSSVFIVDFEQVNVSWETKASPTLFSNVQPKKIFNL